MFTYASAVVLTRVYLQDHTLPQIAVGALLGSVCALATYATAFSKQALV